MKTIVFALALVATFATGIESRADDYPSKPVRILVGFAPGGARVILHNDRLPEALGDSRREDTRCNVGPAAGREAH